MTSDDPDSPARSADPSQSVAGDQSAPQSATSADLNAEPQARSPTNPPAASGVQRQHIRQGLRHRRQSLSTTEVAAHSRKIANRVTPLLSGAQHIAGYLAIGNEVDVEGLLQERREDGCRTYVPLIQPDHTLLFAPLEHDSVILQNRYGIREPACDTRSCIPSQKLDAVLVPLLGFDEQCHRMGMGGGYYDRTFTRLRHVRPGATPTPVPLLIGVAHDLQRVESVLPEWWDVRLDIIVTESHIYPCQDSTQEQ